MSKKIDPGSFDLAAVFQNLRIQMLAELDTGGLLNHSVTVGGASEKCWLELLARFLPGRYSANSVFIVNADGQRSRQIDIAIYDTLQTPALFPHSAGLHIPIESVYAVLEAKSRVSPAQFADAQVKAASVRVLQTTKSRPILAGLVAASSTWTDASFQAKLTDELEGGDPQHALSALARPTQTLDLGCILRQGSFEKKGRLHISTPEESLAFFVIRLIERLREMGPLPPIEMQSYARNLESFR